MTFVNANYYKEYFDSNQVISLSSVRKAEQAGCFVILMFISYEAEREG